MRKFFVLLAALSALACAYGAGLENKGEISMASLLDEMVSRDAVTRFPQYIQRQVSSYDRRSVSPTREGWFANSDGGGFERLEKIDGRAEKVMFDEKGPGAVTRIWLTTKGKSGTLRFYFDGAKEPQLVVPAYDMRRFPVDVPAGLSLTHTHYSEDMGATGGNTFFLPLPYAKSLKITFEEPAVGGGGPRYYHVNYRSYPEETKVRTWSVEETLALKNKMEKVSELLLKPEDFLKGKILNSSAGLAPGKKIGVGTRGSAAIRHLEIQISGVDEADYAAAMRALRVRGAFDGVECVDAPLADFSGAGMGAPAVESWYLQSDGRGRVVCRWVMPFRKSALLELVNNWDKPLDVRIKAVVGTYKWTANSLYFHCSHRFEKGIPLSNNYGSPDNLDWNFATIKGRGVYVGDLLSLYNHAVDWYGEGDEKIWVDDDDFPSHFGTGTEDYYNCSWAPVVVFHTPFGGAPRADEKSSHGYNAFMRTRNLDAIPFKSKFRFDIEMLSWHKGSADYYTTLYWYGDLDAKAEK